jgi:hypothetical protein
MKDDCSFVDVFVCCLVCVSHTQFQVRFAAKQKLTREKVAMGEFSEK